MSGSINDIQRAISPLAGSCRCRNGDAAFLFLWHEVHRGSSVMNFSHPVYPAGIKQHAFCQCGFARINMSNDAYIAHVPHVAEPF